MTKPIKAKCEECGFEGNLEEFKLSYGLDVDVEEDGSHISANASLSCPKCGNSEDLRE